MKTAMDTGYQIYKYDPKYDDAYVYAGDHNWRPTLAEAKTRKKDLEDRWDRFGVKYMIVNCARRPFEG